MGENNSNKPKNSIDWLGVGGTAAEASIIFVECV